MEPKLIDTEIQSDVSFDPIIQAFFRDCAGKLDTYHDRYERIVKLSRDITIESKRVIFLLHRIHDEVTKEKLLAEAEGKLQSVINTFWNRIAKELAGQDPHHFLRAYSPGINFLPRKDIMYFQLMLQVLR